MAKCATCDKDLDQFEGISLNGQRFHDDCKPDFFDKDREPQTNHS